MRVRACADVACLLSFCVCGCCMSLVFLCVRLLHATCLFVCAAVACLLSFCVCGCCTVALVLSVYVLVLDCVRVRVFECT